MAVYGAKFPTASGTMGSARRLPRVPKCCSFIDVRAEGSLSCLACRRAERLLLFLQIAQAFNHRQKERSDGRGHQSHLIGDIPFRRLAFSVVVSVAVVGRESLT